MNPPTLGHKNNLAPCKRIVLDFQPKRLLHPNHIVDALYLSLNLVSDDETHGERFVFERGKNGEKWARKSLGWHSFTFAFNLSIPFSEQLLIDNADICVVENISFCNVYEKEILETLQTLSLKTPSTSYAISPNIFSLMNNNSFTHNHELLDTQNLLNEELCKVT